MDDMRRTSEYRKMLPFIVGTAMDNFTNPMTDAGDMIYTTNSTAGIPQIGPLLSGSATAISDYQGHVASNVLDGNDVTYWAGFSNPVPDNWIYIDLGSVKSIAGYKLYQYPFEGDWGASRFKVQISNDVNNPSWVDIDDVSPTTDTVIRTLSEIQACQFVRFLAVTGGNFSWNVYTIEIYEQNTHLELFDRLAIGAENTVLTSARGVPAWRVPAILTHDHAATYLGLTAQAADSHKVDGAHASATPTASYIPIAGAGGKLAVGWVPDLSGTYLPLHGCADNATNAGYASIAGVAAGATLADEAVSSRTVDGAHASVTPTPSTIPIADATGKLAVGWMPDVDGWTPVSDAWAYASATTITVPAGAAALYVVGDKVKLTQTTVKYFYIITVANTLLTVTGGSDFTVANAAISAISYSHQSAPVGYPDKFACAAPTWDTNTVDNGTGGQQPTAGEQYFSIDNHSLSLTVNGATSGWVKNGTGVQISTSALPLGLPAMAQMTLPVVAIGVAFSYINSADALGIVTNRGAGIIRLQFPSVTDNQTMIYTSFNAVYRF